MKFELFSSPQCSYCEQAKQLLQHAGVEFEVFDIVSSDTHHRELLRRLPSCKTLPQVFLNGKSIGSYEDLQALVDRGELKPVAV